jgi:hypothetical protein
LRQAVEQLEEYSIRRDPVRNLEFRALSER